MSNRRPPLAWRNNNPGNIRYVASIRWQGQEGEGELGFVRFRTPEHGFRALARQIMTYKERDRLDTVRKILARYAPPQGYANGKGYVQNTSGYIARVALDMGVSADAVLEVQNWRVMLNLLRAISDHEAGNGWSWPEEKIVEGLRMAGYDVPPPPIHTTSEARVAGGALAASTAAAALVEVGPHIPAVADLARAAGPWVVALVVALVAGWLVLRAYQRRREMAR